MKILVACGLCALGAALLAPGVACAQSTPAHAFTVLPPASINDPGAKPVEPIKLPKTVKYKSAATPSAPAPASTAIPLPPLPTMHEDGRGDVPPVVKVTHHKGQVIEEYYEGGALYMVQVHPKHGLTYTYFVHKGHTLSRGPGAPKMSPAMFTILSWGDADDASD